MLLIMNLILKLVGQRMVVKRTVIIVPKNKKSDFIHISIYNFVCIYILLFIIDYLFLCLFVCIRKRQNVRNFLIVGKSFFRKGKSVKYFIVFINLKCTLDKERLAYIQISNKIILYGNKR